jgi:hypothetical protein
MMTALLNPPASRHSRLFRCSALVWAVVFVLSGVMDAFAEFDCPHHVAAAVAGEGHHAAADADEHGCHGKDRPGAVAGEGPADAHVHVGSGDGGEEGHRHLCTCTGPCHASGTTAVPLASAAADHPVLLGPATILPGEAGGELPGRAAYLLPFATAPPHVR